MGHQRGSGLVWNRGLFRIWIVCSIVWLVCGAAFVGTKYWNYKPAEVTSDDVTVIRNVCAILNLRLDPSVSLQDVNDNKPIKPNEAFSRAFRECFERRMRESPGEIEAESWSAHLQSTFILSAGILAMPVLMLVLGLVLMRTTRWIIAGFGHRANG